MTGLLLTGTAMGGAWAESAPTNPGLTKADQAPLTGPAFSGILSQEKFSERPDATTPSVPSTATAPEPANSSPTQTTTPSTTSSTTPADAPTMADSSDIDDVTDPAMRKLIQHLVGQGFFEPVTDGRFYPNDPISRAELVTLLYRAYQLNNPFVSEFPY
ncbi:MAG: S-layer homology domain-containing protein [Cyanobacteria bacterium HKST-UBA03]|nr:S-layer homology domain-containing protein [Cyanobacteria bacterium HKST-UBA03]